MCYGCIRFFVEGLRTDSLMFGSLRVAQLVSVAFYVIGSIMLTISISELDDYNKDDKNKKLKEVKEQKEEVKKGNKANEKKTTKKNSKKKVK